MATIESGSAAPARGAATGTALQTKTRLATATGLTETKKRGRKKKPRVYQKEAIPNEAEIARRARIGIPYLRSIWRHGNAPYHTAQRLGAITGRRMDDFLHGVKGEQTKRRKNPLRLGERQRTETTPSRPRRRRAELSSMSETKNARAARTWRDVKTPGEGEEVKQF